METQRNTLRVHFIKAELTDGLLEDGHPYPDVEWTIEGGVLFMRFAGGSEQTGKLWDLIFSPAKWSRIEIQ
ncbi:hypothetical protein [Gordonia sp. N1V]|uniref:hypothetical protein n=1 Tax=Gordonia sp. N1V TaxID=3034163 RepID=UPI0023E1A9B1|nr:hypothetical protein [Gordonia sp. N1V]MDF3283369.1 hypothetical protein [Gordonia sp. N1V]